MEKSGRILVESGDVVFCYSDGIIEAAGESSELFEFDQVARIIADPVLEASNAEQIINNLFSETNAFSAGYEQEDDQTIFVVRASWIEQANRSPNAFNQAAHSTSLI